MTNIYKFKCYSFLLSFLNKTSNVIDVIASIDALNLSNGLMQ